eukprot:249485-Rhodomonas_salina.1
MSARTKQPRSRLNLHLHRGFNPNSAKTSTTHWVKIGHCRASPLRATAACDTAQGARTDSSRRVTKLSRRVTYTREESRGSREEACVALQRGT